MKAFWKYYITGWGLIGVMLYSGFFIHDLAVFGYSAIMSSVMILIGVCEEE